MIKFLDNYYEIVFGEDVFIYDTVKELVTDYFLPFDYIFGDYAYEKLRLKGFYDASFKDVKDYNNIDNLEKYIEDYCAFSCKKFLLKKKKD